MHLSHIIFFLLATECLAEDLSGKQGTTSRKKPLPKHKTYALTGTIELPDSDIFEPFAVIFDGKKNRSRVDYYNGMVRTLQFGSNSGNKMLSYHLGRKEADVQCFELIGGSKFHVSAQIGLPSNLDQYGYVGETALSGSPASHYRFEDFSNDKALVYNYYVHSETMNPIRYEFTAFDKTINATIDKQIIEYDFFAVASPTDALFEIDARDVKCQQFPNAANLKQSERQPTIDFTHLVEVMNPLGEFLPMDQSTASSKLIDDKYEKFKRQYRTHYASESENERRKAIFRHNVRYIESSNRANLGYRLALNHFADWNIDELELLNGYKSFKETGEGFDRSKHNLRKISELPDAIDFRNLGIIGPVGDQKLCASDFAFATTGAVEAAFALKHGHLTKLSEQELLDCSTLTGNRGCKGGSHSISFDWIKQNGLASQIQYGPYLGNFSSCHFKDSSFTASLLTWVKFEPKHANELRWALAANGALVSTVDASHRSFIFYAGGIYSEPKCTKIFNLNHSVLVVGFGKIEDREYFLIKNSWSTDWGNAGYMLIDASNNNCGLVNQITFPVL